MELDYFGMSEDLKAIHERSYQKSRNDMYLPLGFCMFLDSLLEFENYCLQQNLIIPVSKPKATTSDLTKLYFSAAHC